MTRALIHRRRRSHRDGATAVEVAFVMPVFLVFIFVLVEYGHMLWINNMLEAAVRNATRFGTTEGATNEDVEDYIRDFMSGTVLGEDIEILIKDGSVFDSGDENPESNEDYENLDDVDVSDVPTRQLFIVRASVEFGDISFLPFPGIDQIRFSSQSIMRHE